MLASALEIEATSQETRFHADLEPESKHVDFLELLGIDLSITNVELLDDAQLHLRHGTCYGLVGRNGVGKSTLQRAIAERRLVGFPRCMSVRFVQQDAVGDDRTALQTLLDTDQVGLQYGTVMWGGIGGGVAAREHRGSGYPAMGDKGMRLRCSLLCAFPPDPRVLEA